MEFILGMILVIKLEKTFLRRIKLMLDTDSRESRTPAITDNEDLNTNYWINGLLAWWSGFSLRTKLLAIATLVVSLLMPC
jgi:hypothetical protein